MRSMSLTPERRGGQVAADGDPRVAVDYNPPPGAARGFRSKANHATIFDHSRDADSGPPRHRLRSLRSGIRRAPISLRLAALRVETASIARPWDLATALSNRTVVQPGDTIWLRGGRYTFPAGGNIRCGLRGTASAPITVAQYPGERATLDLKGAARGLLLHRQPQSRGSRLRQLQGLRDHQLRHQSSHRNARSHLDPDLRPPQVHQPNRPRHGRRSSTSRPTPPTRRSTAASSTTTAPRTAWSTASTSRTSPDTRKPSTTSSFNNAGFGIHAFPHDRDSALLDVSLIGNIAFNNGLLGTSKPHPDILLGGDAIAISPVIDGNATYKAAPGACGTR